MTDEFIYLIGRKEKIARDAEEYEDRVAKKVLHPTVAWIKKIMAAYPMNATGETLDEQMTALLQKGFIQKVLFATYGQLHISGAFESAYPKTAQRLEEIYMPAPKEERND